MHNAGGTPAREDASIKGTIDWITRAVVLRRGKVGKGVFKATGANVILIFLPIQAQDAFLTVNASLCVDVANGI